MLGIVASYHCMQFQGKHMILTQENKKKTHFGDDLGLLGPNSGRQNFFFFFSKTWLGQAPDIMVSMIMYNIKRN